MAAASSRAQPAPSPSIINGKKTFVPLGPYTDTAWTTTAHLSVTSLREQPRNPLRAILPPPSPEPLLPRHLLAHRSDLEPPYTAPRARPNIPLPHLRLGPAPSGQLPRGRAGRRLPRCDNVVPADDRARLWSDRAHPRCSQYRPVFPTESCPR